MAAAFLLIRFVGGDGCRSAPTTVTFLTAADWSLLQRTFFGVTGALSQRGGGTTSSLHVTNLFGEHQGPRRRRRHLRGRLDRHWVLHQVGDLVAQQVVLLLCIQGSNKVEKVRKQN